MKNKKRDLITLAEALLKYETLDREQVEKLLRGEEINRDFSKEKVDYSKINLSMFSPESIEEEVEEDSKAKNIEKDSTEQKETENKKPSKAVKVKKTTIPKEKVKKPTTARKNTKKTEKK